MPPTDFRKSPTRNGTQSIQTYNKYVYMQFASFAKIENESQAKAGNFHLGSPKICPTIDQSLCLLIPLCISPFFDGSVCFLNPLLFTALFIDCLIALPKGCTILLAEFFKIYL